MTETKYCPEHGLVEVESDRKTCKGTEHSLRLQETKPKLDREFWRGTLQERKWMEEPPDRLPRKYRGRHTESE
jgi:hypothetical protein